MIKIPATEAGYCAMEHLTSLGINVNATLVFSPLQAKKCAKALNRGIKKSAKDTKGVVSVFVSRFDRMLDAKLKEKGLPTGKTGIINATACYYEITKNSEKNVRTLFASTGVKGDGLPPSYYIDELIFPDSVNTAPLKTIKEWIKNGKKVASKIVSQAECVEYFDMLKAHNIDMNNVYKKLLQDGLSAFKVSFEELLSKVKK